MTALTTATDLPTPSSRTRVEPLTWPQRIVAGVAGVFFAGLAGLGGWGSFASVRQVAEPWFGTQAWIIPAGVDLGILAVVTVALLLEWLAMPMPALRWIALAFTGATVWLNVSAAHGDPSGIVMHAAMPALFITFIEALRHAVRRRAGMATGTLREGIPIARWMVAPISTARLWRRMIRWQLTSYSAALRTEQQRLHALTLLRAHYGRAWATRAPGDVVWMLADGVMLETAFARVAELTATSAGDIRSDPGIEDDMSHDAFPPRGGRPGERRQGRPGQRHDTGRTSEMSRDMHSDIGADTEARALVILAEEPDISGADLGRRLDLSARQGQRMLSRLTRRPSGATQERDAQRVTVAV